MILLERVARARKAREGAEAKFRETLIAARELHSWAEIASVAGLSKHGVRYLVEGENEKRKERAA